MGARTGDGVSESLTVQGWRSGAEATVDAAHWPALGELRLDRPRAHRRYTRGALVRRMLLLADVVGLIASFAIASVLVAPQLGATDKVGPRFEFVAFLLAIPGWLLLLRLEGLYDRDEERTDHSTVDDIVGVFRSVTIGVWVFAVFGVATNLVHPVLARLGVFWLVAVVLDPDAARGRAHALPPPARLQPERGHRRRGQGRPAARAQAD